MFMGTGWTSKAESFLFARSLPEIDLIITEMILVIAVSKRLQASTTASSMAAT